METDSKAFKTSAIKLIQLFKNRFGIEPEITLKLVKKNLNFWSFDLP
jgi:hypothetical protein